MAVIQRRLTKAGEKIEAEKGKGKAPDKEVRWTVRHYRGRDANGKRQFTVKTYRKQKDAKVAAAKLEAQQGDGTGLVMPSKQPFGEYLTAWLEVHAGQVSKRTLHDYTGIVGRWIHNPPEGAPMLALIPLNRLTRAGFQDLLTWMRENGRGPRTIQYVHTVLRMALRDAVASGELRANPTDYVKLPKNRADGAAKPKKLRAMTKEQSARFLEAARADRHSALFHVLLLGGLRPSEALALRWSDVDAEKGTVTVSKSLTRTGVDGWLVVDTKTPQSHRTIPLPDVAMREIARWRALQGRERLALGEEWHNHDFMFTTWNGEPLDRGNVYARNFHRIMEAAELGEMETVKVGRKVKKTVRRFRPAFVLYDMRHTFATLLLSAGVPLKTVSELLGHSTIKLTADVYGHVYAEDKQTGADRLQALFG